MSGSRSFGKKKKKLCLYIAKNLLSYIPPANYPQSFGSFAYIHFCLCMSVRKGKYKENIFSCSFYHVSMDICSTVLTKLTRHTKVKKKIKTLENVEFNEKSTGKTFFLLLLLFSFSFCPSSLLFPFLLLLLHIYN